MRHIFIPYRCFVCTMGKQFSVTPPPCDSTFASQSQQVSGTPATPATPPPCNSTFASQSPIGRSSVALRRYPSASRSVFVVFFTDGRGFGGMPLVALFAPTACLGGDGVLVVFLTGNCCRLVRGVGANAVFLTGGCCGLTGRAWVLVVFLTGGCCGLAGGAWVLVVFLTGGCCGLTGRRWLAGRGATTAPSPLTSPPPRLPFFNIDLGRVTQ